jgi:carboxymethylenebutenolidase
MEQVKLAVADGTSMNAYVARPAGNPKAGLIVFQEAFGVNAHIRDVTQRFAKEGYLAIAPELFHRTAPGLEAGYTDFPAVMPHMQALTTEGLEADIKAAFDWMKTNAHGLKIGATGYCMGGRTACLAAITVPLDCSISYYGGGIGPNPMFPNLVDRLKDLKAPMMFFWGGLDTFIPPEQSRAVTDALRAAHKPHVNVEFSFADHGFFCDARANYNKEAATEAWGLTLSFLSAHTS